MASTTIPGVLESWAAKQPGKTLFTFVDDKGRPSQALTYAECLAGGQAIAASLARFEAGTRVILAYAPGLDFIVSFLGCLAAGVIPVPVYPPNPTSLDADLPKLCHVAQDSQAAAILTSSSYYRVSLAARAFGLATCRCRRGGRSTWPALEWVVTDRVAARAIAEATTATSSGASASTSQPEAERRPPPDPGSVAFLQYTSGSTSDPKGVMVTHRALLHNVRLIARQLGRPAAIIPPSGVEVSWLPQYHDMGLIGGYLVTLFVGATGYYMSPLSFLRDPLLWLRLISAHGGTHTQAPDFAYALCARRAQTCRAAGSDADRQALADLDLSSLAHAFNAADTVRAASMDAFVAAFAANGFDPRAFSPGYGLAENTVYVSDGGGTRFMLDRAALEGDGRRAVGDMEAVGLGVPPPEVEIAIVDPETRRRCPVDRVGEIWVRSDSKAAGYWGKQELSQQMFEAAIAGESESDHEEDSRGGRRHRSGRRSRSAEAHGQASAGSAKGASGSRNERRGEHLRGSGGGGDGGGGGGYLRTGDLGMLTEERGELVFVGRIKDIIVVRGRNLAPQDVERAVEAASRGKDRQWWQPWRGLGDGSGTASVAPRCLRRGGTVIFASTPRGASGAQQRIVFLGELDTRPDVTRNDNALLPSTGAAEAAGATGGATAAALDGLVSLVRKTVAKEFGVTVDVVMLLPPRSIPRTTSGKLRRQAARASFEDGTLQAKSICLSGGTVKSGAAAGSGLAKESDGSGAGVDTPFADTEDRAKLRVMRRRRDRVKTLTSLLLQFLGQRGIRAKVFDEITAAGADSVTLLELHEAMQRDLDVKLPISFLVDHKTIRSVADGLESVLPLPAGADTDMFGGSDGGNEDSDGGDEDGVVAAPGGALGGGSACYNLVDLVLSKRTCTLLVGAGVAAGSYVTMAERDVGWYEQPKILFEGPGMRNEGWIKGRMMDEYHGFWITYLVDDLPVELVLCAVGLIVHRLIAYAPLSITRRFQARSFCDASIGIAGMVYLHRAKALFVGLLVLVNLIAVRALRTLHPLDLPGGARWHPLAIFTWVFALLVSVVNHYSWNQTCVQIAERLGIPLALRGWAKLADGFHDSYPPASHRELPRSVRYLLLRMMSFNFDLLEADQAGQPRCLGPTKGSPSEEDADAEGEKLEGRGLLACLGYLFYSPLALHGPTMTHGNFHNDVIASLSSSTAPVRPRFWRRITYGIVSVALSILLLTLSLHYFYYPAVIFFSVHSELRPWEWFFYGGAHMTFMYVSNSAFYRLAHTMALADGVQAPEEMPADLMAATASFRVLWASYHRSWHEFFMRYIFFPVGGGYRGIVVTVGFSLVLHGLGTYWLLWSGFNLVGFVLEKRLLSFAWYRRPGWLVRVINRSVVVIAHVYPFDVFTYEGFLQLVWMIVVFVALYETWGCTCWKASNRAKEE